MTINTMADSLENKMQDLFIADSGLDDIKALIRGEPITIPLQHHPAMIIFIERQEDAQLETGLFVYQYAGYIAIETQIPDSLSVVARKATIESYPTVRNLLDAATDVLEANLSLGGISYGTETVRGITQISGKVYGLQQRSNNINNRGEVAFAIETQKPRT